MAEPQAAAPAADFQNTPEFAAAVAAATAEVIKQMGGRPAVSDGDGNWMKQLALGIAELTDQGTSRKRVAPEILAKRDEARKAMIALLVEAHDNGEKPEYRLVNETYLNEQLLKPFYADKAKVVHPTEIIWTGVPNECMRPINDVAKGIFEQFVKSIGGSASVDLKGPAQPFWVTRGGLVVKGQAGAAQRREVGTPGAPLPDPFANELGTKTTHDPSAEFVHVLGTIQPPARQNYQPGQ